MDLHLLGKQPIPRRYVRNDSPPVSTTIHGYCDTSVMAYGGVVYIRTMHQDSSVSVTMISAKTRLAPLHSVTIPCLELCGALTLAKLLSSVMKDVQLDITQVNAWTDSTIVLGWLRKAPTRLKVFVANRIMQIKELVPTMSWHHVDTRHNPADILSRGAKPGELITSRLWWEGPDWLHQPPSSWPFRTDLDLTLELPELKQTVLSIKVLVQEYGTCSSSWSRLCRATARIIRMFRMFSSRRSSSSLCYLEHLTLKELKYAKFQLFRMNQEYTYPNEMTMLKNSKSLPCSSTLCKCNLYLDNVRFCA